MIGTLIFVFMCLWILCLFSGILLAKIMWTPPVKGVK